MKKILTIVISVALVAAIAIGGTLAYLTSTANDTTLQNTFTTSTAGSQLDIELDEGIVDELDGEFTGGRTSDSQEYPIIPGAVMDKDPTVTVLANSAPCYVFAFINNTVKVNNIDAITLGAINSNWTAVAGSPGLYVYTGTSDKVVLTSTSNTALPAIFNEITVNSALTVTDTKQTPVGAITVQAYAYQASAGVTPAIAEAAAIDLFF